MPLELWEGMHMREGDNMIWNGPTPYDGMTETQPFARELLVSGYRAAMNSPEVKAMYEAILRVLAEPGGLTKELMDAATASEAGLRDE